ncbi:hypothetical protein DFH06DRAFT_1323566 [Mycena polygramma]|nr:hypothetical protein DFH06DRAFT_1323566 [Mycena polygramma]
MSLVLQSELMLGFSFFCCQSAPQAPGRGRGVLLHPILVFWCLAAGQILRSQRFFGERWHMYATAEAPVGYRPRRLGGTCIRRDLSGLVLAKVRAPNNGPRFEYTSCRRNFSAPNARYDLPKAARAPSNLISAAHSLRPQRITFVSSFWFLGVEIIFHRSTTKSTSPAFARHRAFRSGFISSHRSRPRFSVGVPDIHVKLLLRSFSTWVSKVSTALALWRNTAANDFAGPVARSALPNPHSTPLKAFFSVSRLTQAAYHIQVLLFFRLEIVSKNQQRPVEPWYLSRLIV